VEAHTGAPPACRYADVLTPFHYYANWQTTLVDTIYDIPSTYAPGDLVPTGIAGGGYVRSLAITDLRAMSAAATAAGAPIQVVSSYRSYATQISTFNYWVGAAGYSAALLASARPGHSEHQLGTAIDFGSRTGTAPWNYTDWATTKAGAWMKTNAWKYGWVMSYPKATSPSITCYQYEPWHYRYVGRTEAAAIHASGLTTREYLWKLQP
jgi:D-alanyl-D-alanine carboxypeptidase